MNLSRDRRPRPRPAPSGCVHPSRPTNTSADLKVLGSLESVGRVRAKCSGSSTSGRRRSSRAARRPPRAPTRRAPPPGPSAASTGPTGRRTGTRPPASAHSPLWTSLYAHLARGHERSDSPASVSTFLALE